MLALVDVASNVVLGHELARSENAAATARLIKRVCERWGIFDRLYTDNGRAFASQLVAGAAPFRFRGKKGEFKRPPGLCDHLGIEVVFAQPGNAQAKIAERAFATLSRAIDDRPEFAGARTGHGPGKQAERGTGAVLLAVAEAVIARELDRYNREGGRRVQGSRWPSYQAALEEGLKGRITRVLTARQSYLAGLVYAPAAVDRWGRVALDGWTYGDPATQAALIGYHGQGRILIGRDPDDLAAPAVAYTAVGELICEGIAPVKPGAYGSKEGARQAARNRKAAREAAALAEAKHDLMTRAELAAALAQLPGGPARPPEPRPAKGVVAGRFGGPLRPNGGPAAARVTGPSPEMERNFLSALAECEARGVKLDVILAERQGMAAKGA
jgi:putative transposase